MKRNTFGYKFKTFMEFGGITTFCFLAVVVMPFIYGLYLTFTSWDGVSKTKPFVGMSNYAATFADADFWLSIARTLFYSAFSVILVNVVAFLLAYLVTSGIKGQNFFRAGFFIPNLIGGIVLGFVWKFVFNRAFTAVGTAIEFCTVKAVPAFHHGRRHVLPDLYGCLAVCRIYDADLRGRFHERG
jgi:raffinose/stachyose/melibiose transport system permease protein